MSKEDKYGLFNNPMVESAKASMTNDQLEEYRKKGEAMYNSVDFVSSDGKTLSVPQEMADAVLYIVNSIQSGQHISFLEDNEKQIMKDTYGDEWYARFGFTKGDVEEIVTLGGDLGLK